MKSYYFEEISIPNLGWFKMMSYDEMSKSIETLEKLLGDMKEIRKTRLAKEIEETEEKLKRLREK